MRLPVVALLEEDYLTHGLHVTQVSCLSTGLKVQTLGNSSQVFLQDFPSSKRQL